MRDLRQTPQYANYMEAIGWNVDKSQGFYAYIKKFPILGNFIKIQRPEKINYETIALLRNKYKPFQIIVEPKFTEHYSLVTEQGFRQSKTYFVPSKTIQIDLTKSENQLLKEMHYKTRYNIKKVISSKLKVINSKDINYFSDFWQRCALRQRGMFINQKREIVEIYKAFKKKSDILYCKKDNEVLAGLMLLHANKISYYMYAASTNEGKKLYAPTVTAWEGIKLCKKRGSMVFDFEGIYDERFPLKSWQGFSRFKKSFAGRVIEYPGTYTKFYLPFL